MQEAPDRATLFNTVAYQYDLYRPEYPSVLVDEMLHLSRVTPASRLLEVGCGTGKATMSVASRGYSIDCVDPGDNLVSVAKRNCIGWPRVRFFVGGFEDIPLPHVAYDLIFSAQAFHWVDQNVRWQRCKDLLAPEGSVALMYNYSLPPEDGVGKEIHLLVDRELEGKTSIWDNEASIQRWKEEMDATALFGPVEIKRYRWARRCNVEQYAGLFGTYSDFLSLSTASQRRITGGIREILARNGGFIDHNYESVLFHGRRVSPKEP